MVRIDEVDATVLVRHEHAAGREFRNRVVVLHLHHGGRAGFAHHGGALCLVWVGPGCVRGGRSEVSGVSGGRGGCVVPCLRKHFTSRCATVSGDSAGAAAGVSVGGVVRVRTMTSGTDAKPRVPSTWRATRDRRMADMTRAPIAIGGMTETENLGR